MIQRPLFPLVKPSFQTELRKRVDAYFKDNNINPTGNWKVYLKTGIIAITFIATYATIVFFEPGTAMSIALCMFLGLGVAAIGFNIMHDGAHGSYSKSPFINQLAASSLDLMGASSSLWKIKHNVIHHTYTNIDDFDDDINIGPWIRVTTSQKKRFFHKFQHIYFIFFYSLLHLFWISVTDFKKFFGKKIGSIPIKKFGWKEHLSLWGSKALFIGLFIIIPIHMKGLMPFLAGFFIFSCTIGISLSLVFQLAHVVETTAFPEADKITHKMEDEWTVHQLKTTANFATKNKIITWFTGGLNYQIEHHLFPKVSHIHYPAISQIVKQASADFGLVYNEYKTMISALLAHINQLKKIGAAA